MNLFYLYPYTIKLSKGEPLWRGGDPDFYMVLKLLLFIFLKILGIYIDRRDNKYLLESTQPLQ